MIAIPAVNTPGFRNPWRALTWSVAAILILLPAIAMQFTTEVAWGPEDFLVIGMMLAFGALCVEVGLKVSPNHTYMVALVTTVGTGFLLIFVNLAVGVIGSEGNPMNLLFAGVLAIGLIGAAFARLRPAGMALAVLAMAIAQELIAMALFVDGQGRIAVLVSVFALAWLISGFLFHRSSDQ